MAKIKFIDKDLQGIVLRDQVFDDFLFKGCDMRKADLRGSSFSNGSFERCALQRSDLRGCAFKGVSLKGSNLEDAFVDRKFPTNITNPPYTVIGASDTYVGEQFLNRTVDLLLGHNSESFKKEFKKQMIDKKMKESTTQCQECPECEKVNRIVSYLNGDPVLCFNCETHGRIRDAFKKRPKGICYYCGNNTDVACYGCAKRELSK